ncbi:MAG TPA: CRISPR system precrRNA processing endoribonuclease RAMP protein Cas6 [Thermoanaerobaculia bacterium]|nr:CRISPR system precrRNA processing endoribonuclease RAMP protein Cas6 [Thermoanaerobaculia bacterium]
MTFSYLRLELAVAPVSGSRQLTALAAPLLRRVLGLALIARFCPFGEPRCQAPPTGGGAAPPPSDLCDLAAACPYGVLFAASRTRRPPFALFVPPPKGSGDGEPGVIEITLFGPACGAYAWLLAAFADALERGLGKTRQKWALAEVCRTGPDGDRERLCGPDLTALPSILAPSLLNLAGSAYVAPAPVEVILRSPARLLRQGRLLKGREPVPFEVLIARILDRFKNLYGAAAAEVLDARLRADLEAEAARVPLLGNETDWVEVQDYSARSGAEMLLGGKVGRLLYGPEAAKFLPILQAGEILHAGKNATSGCGRLEARLAAARKAGRDAGI